MADLPDWYTQTQPATMEAESLTHGADAAKPASPTAGAVYYASNTKILYICATDGIWTGFDAAILVQGTLTLYANLVGGGYRITGLGAPTTQNDALRYGQAEIRNAEIAAAAGIVYSKLYLALGIVNADISASAAIVYSKLVLTGGIVNTDISALAAIAYSKLNLLTSIVNADIAAGAAIAYSKLNLTNSILTADILSTEFNVASKLLKLDASALVPVARIPTLTAYITHALATAVNDFLVASGAGAYVKKTLAEVQSILGLGTAAYTAATAYVTHALATAANDFLVASGSGAFVKKTLAETLTILMAGHKVKAETRGMTAASGDVSYTGYGFTPTGLIIFAYLAGLGSIGGSDPAKASIEVYQAAAFAFTNKIAYIYDAANTASQTAIVKSYDADGFTLTWTKTGSPTGTAALTVFAFK